MNSSNVLTDQQYIKFRNLINERLGLHFPSKKRRDLERAIMGAFSQSTTSSLDEYCDLLAIASKDNREMQRLVALATVGETYFYRDRKQFDLLRTTILPQLINARSATTRQLRLWSAGCATGEEPYTLAMVVKELIPLTEFWDIHILGTDINDKALNKALSAAYGSWSFRSNDGHSLLDKYFEKHGREYRVKDEIKKLVKIEYLNLSESLYPAAYTGTDNLDLIIFRNVAIYFSPETTDAIARRMVACLAEGGWILTGASDPTLSKIENLVLRDFDGCFIYQKTSAPQLAIAPVKITAPPELPVSEIRRRDSLEEVAALVDQGKPEEAISLLRQDTDSSKDSARACYMIAKLEADSGNLTEAKRQCELAVENNKLMIEAHYLLAIVCQELGDDEGAIAALKKSIYINRTFAEAYVCLGSIYRRLGKEQQAGKAFANASRILEDRHAESLVTLPGSHEASLRR